MRPLPVVPRPVRGRAEPVYYEESTGTLVVFYWVVTGPKRHQKSYRLSTSSFAGLRCVESPASRDRGETREKAGGNG